jgi:hypothetical protein
VDVFRVVDVVREGGEEAEQLLRARARRRVGERGEVERDARAGLQDGEEELLLGAGGARADGVLRASSADIDGVP